MTLISILLGLLAAAALLAAGYLYGTSKGTKARDSLRALNRDFARDLVRHRERIQQPRIDDDGLRATLQDILSPLVQRERLSLDMARLEGHQGQERDLTAVLDQMAEKGNFSSVLLSDAQGWRLAASTATQDPERLGATASLLLLIADRIGRNGAPAPLTLMVHDSAGMTTLCRLFPVGSQRLTLTVVATGGQLTPLAVDPALARLTSLLLHREGSGAASSQGDDAAPASPSA